MLLYTYTISINTVQFDPKHWYLKVTPKSVVSLWLIVQVQLKWILSQGKCSPKKNSNSWNVQCTNRMWTLHNIFLFWEPILLTQSKYQAVFPPVLCKYLIRLLGWIDLMVFHSWPGLQHEIFPQSDAHLHSEQTVKHPSDQKIDTHEPNLGLGGSLLGDQLLHTWLRDLGISCMVPWGFMGTPSIITLREKKKKKKTA